MALLFGSIATAARAENDEKCEWATFAAPRREFGRRLAGGANHATFAVCAGLAEFHGCARRFDGCTLRNQYLCCKARHMKIKLWLSLAGMVLALAVTAPAGAQGIDNEVLHRLGDFLTPPIDKQYPGEQAGYMGLDP